MSKITQWGDQNNVSRKTSCTRLPLVSLIFSSGSCLTGVRLLQGATARNERPFWHLWCFVPGGLVAAGLQAFSLGQGRPWLLLLPHITSPFHASHPGGGEGVWLKGNLLILFYFFLSPASKCVCSEEWNNIIFCFAYRRVNSHLPFPLLGRSFNHPDTCWMGESGGIEQPRRYGDSRVKHVLMVCSCSKEQPYPGLY